MSAGDNDDATVAGGKRHSAADLHAERAELVANRYQIIRWLGGGGMGRVYEALDTELGERIALKTLNSDLSAAAIERFRREVRLTRKIQHANVARMIDIGEHDGERFLTMELVDGPTLKSELGATMPWARLARIAAQICAGLEAAHRVGVIHRDLKPDNVLIERTTDRAVITDFGIAHGSEEIALTQVGAVIGTPRYMAPEQLAGNPADVRSDLFALGVVLYELATASRPWPGNDPAAIAIAQLTHPPRPFAGGDAPAAFREIVMRCLAIDPMNRPASALEIQHAIEQARPTDPGPDRTTDEPRTSPVMSPRSSGPITQPDPATAIAVLPYACTAEDEYLADGIVEDLIDTLSTTAGLRVRPAGLVRTRTDPDPREVGGRLGVDHVISGSVRRIAGALRVATRLISVADGFQIWAQRKDCSDADVLTVSAEHARAVAIALSTRAHGAPKPTDPRAVDLYLRARSELRRFWGAHNEAASKLLEEAALYAPSSPAILGALAYATVQAWLMRNDPALLPKARTAIERGLATGHGEAYLGSAVFKFNHHDPVGAAADLATALIRAPMSAQAHETSGKILDELGVITEARVHLETARGLDPGRGYVIETELARLEALHDDNAAAIRRLQPLADSADPSVSRLGKVYQIRILSWHRDRERMRILADQLKLTRDDRVNPAVAIVYECVRADQLLADRWDLALTQFGDVDRPTRTRVLGYQVMTEIALVFGDPARAIDALRLSAKLGLIDITWLDRCPLFDATFTAQPVWREVHDEVSARATRVLGAFRAAGG